MRYSGRIESWKEFRCSMFVVKKLTRESMFMQWNAARKRKVNYNNLIYQCDTQSIGTVLCCTVLLLLSSTFFSIYSAMEDFSNPRFISTLLSVSSQQEHLLVPSARREQEVMRSNLTRGDPRSQRSMKSSYSVATR